MPAATFARLTLRSVCLFATLTCSSYAAPTLHDRAEQIVAAGSLAVIQDEPDAWHLECRLVVPVTRSVAWQTLTDFDHLSEFVPSLALSRRTTWQGSPAVEQIGDVRMLGIHIHKRVLFREMADASAGRLQLDAVDGDFRRFTQSWLLTRVLDATQVDYHSVVQLKHWVPQWFLKWRIKSLVRASITSLVAEALTRQARHTPGGPA